MKIALDAARDLPTCRRTPSHASSVDLLQASGQENLITWARSILRYHERLREKYPKEVEHVCVCTIAAACVAAEENPNPRLTMGVVRSPSRWFNGSLNIRCVPMPSIEFMCNDRGKVKSSI